MSEKVVIVGAGPAGIFTALEMLKNGTKKEIVIIEKGASCFFAALDSWADSGIKAVGGRRKAERVPEYLKNIIPNVWRWIKA